MNTDLHTFTLIILCGIVTLLMRIIPFILISRVHLPEIVVEWLSFIPITLFTALVIDGVIQQHDNTFGYTLNLPYIVAIIPTVFLAIFTRSLTVTIVGGIIIIACLRFFF
ncbi:AzlD domain-containing protein [Staphylococcus caprae]|uniref:AzlD domain-containing protein n=1 Tax=Staphylococcus caprae TaxID=29380 RepID=UPI003B22456D